MAYVCVGTGSRLDAGRHSIEKQLPAVPCEHRRQILAYSQDDTARDLLLNGTAHSHLESLKENYFPIICGVVCSCSYCFIDETLVTIIGLFTNVFN